MYVHVLERNRLLRGLSTTLHYSIPFTQGEYMCVKSQVKFVPETTTYASHVYTVPQTSTGLVPPSPDSRLYYLCQDSDASCTTIFYITSSSIETHLQKLTSRMKELFELSGSPGLSLGVLYQGVPLCTSDYRRRRASEPTPPNDDTLYNVASITKLMTAGVVSRLVARGLLDWDVPIRENLPEFGERTTASRNDSGRG